MCTVSCPRADRRGPPGAAEARAHQQHRQCVRYTRASDPALPCSCAFSTPAAARLAATALPTGHCRETSQPLAPAGCPSPARQAGVLEYLLPGTAGPQSQAPRASSATLGQGNLSPGREKVRRPLRPLLHLLLLSPWQALGTLVQPVPRWGKRGRTGAQVLRVLTGISRSFLGTQ